MGFLIFAVKCLDVLAWPVLALGYPLCASIRAIETNSNSDMQKLITYWILFSFISLFELGFVKLIEWLSFWPYLKLLATCLLVLPHFDGAYHVYELLVSPCFSVSPQGVINKFNKPKEELSLKKEDFLAVAERYLKENGPEALEKLIAKESKGAKPNDDVEVIKAVANTEKKEVASAIEMDCRDTLAVGKGLKCTEPNVAQEHIKPVELAEKNAATAANQAKDAGPNLDQTEKKTAAAAEIKEMRAESAPGGENKPPEINPQKVQKEWTCAICQVTTTAENVLKSHLQGKKHRAKCEELNASKQAEKNKGSFLNSKGAKPNDDVEVIKAVTNTEKKEVASAIQMDCRDTPAVGKGLKCKEPNVAQEHLKPVELSEKNAAAAANQAKHVGSNLDQTEKKTAAAAEIKEMRAESAPGGENKPPEITPQKVKHAGPNDLDQMEKKTAAATEIKEMRAESAPGGENKPPEITPRKVQKEWTCAICQVTTTCENNLKSHFQGMRHRDKCKELKAIKRAEKNKGSSSSAANKGPNQNETKKQKEKVQVTGTSEQKNVKNTNTGIKQSVLWCSICNVRCPGEIDMASHLSGRKHLSRIQDLLSVGGCANA